MMDVPILCRVCLTSDDNCETVWRIDDIPATQFIKEIFQIEVKRQQCLMCKRCERELSNFYVFYKMVKNAQQKNVCTLEGEYLKQEKIIIKQEICLQTNEANKKHNVKEENPDSVNNVSFDYSANNAFDDSSADRPDCYTDNKEVLDLENKVGGVSMATNNIDTNTKKNTVIFKKIKMATNADKNIDTSIKVSQVKKKKSIRLFDIKKEAQDAKSRHKQAFKTFLSKYSLDQVYENDKWLINDEQKNEIISWFVELKCNFEVCSALASFENMCELEQHSTSVHYSYPRLFCCNRLYLPDSVLHMHILTKHLLKNKKVVNIYVACNVCGKSVRKLNMKHHLYRHLPNNKRNIQCDQCDARFITNFKLKIHQESSHSTQAVPCDICGKEFRSKNSMQIHKLRHTKKKFHLCPECGKKIVDAAHFKDHMEEHYVKEINVKCEICSKVVKKMYLRRHMRVHNPETLRQCPHCPYKTSRSLNEHINRVHEKVKPHACPMCPMKFLTKKSLGDHVSSRHTGIPRYNCPFCDKKFMHSGNHLTHQKRMHPKELAEKKLKMAEKTDNIPIGKLTKKKMTILEGEASVVLENKLITTKANRICDTMEPLIMSTSSNNEMK